MNGKTIFQLIKNTTCLRHSFYARKTIKKSFKLLLRYLDTLISFQDHLQSKECLMLPYILIYIEFNLLNRFVSIEAKALRKFNSWFIVIIDLWFRNSNWLVLYSIIWRVFDVWRSDIYLLYSWIHCIYFI